MAIAIPGTSHIAVLMFLCVLFFGWLTSFVLFCCILHLSLSLLAGTGYGTSFPCPPVPSKRRLFEKGTEIFRRFPPWQVQCQNNASLIASELRFFARRKLREGAKLFSAWWKNFFHVRAKSANESGTSAKSNFWE